MQHPITLGIHSIMATQPGCYPLGALLRPQAWLQVVAILEAGHPLPFTVKAANLDLPGAPGGAAGDCQGKVPLGCTAGALSAMTDAAAN